MISVIILAIIQGIAEFLPISSSAHLIIFREVFGIGKDVISGDLGLTFDIALHLGTALAIIVFFFKDFLNMAIKGFTKGVKDKDGKIMWYLIAATVPAALAGVLFEDVIDNVIREKYYLIAIALIVMGVIIYLVDKKCPRDKEIKDMTLKDALIIGCSQVFALIPGFSRSGTTIAAGRALHLEREDAAKFSFYLSLPVTSAYSQSPNIPFSRVDFPFPSSPIMASLSFWFSVKERFFIRNLSSILILKLFISNIIMPSFLA